MTVRGRRRGRVGDRERRDGAQRREMEALREGDGIERREKTSVRRGDRALGIRERARGGRRGDRALGLPGDAGAWRRSKGARGRDEMRARVRRGLGGLDLQGKWAGLVCWLGCGLEAGLDGRA